jgi:hypothetical protein
LLADKSSERAGAAAVLAHIVWVLGVIAVTWACSIWVGITTYQPASIGFFKDLNYSATIVHGLWMLGLLLVALHVVLHAYQSCATDADRFPGQLGTLVIPRTLRWLRIAIFVAIVVGPTGAYASLVYFRMIPLSIVHNGGRQADPDTKTRFALLTGWGTTNRPEGRSIFHGWHWYSWNDDRKSYRTSSNPTGIDAWPGFFSTLHAALAAGLIASLVWLVLRPVQK